MTKPRIASVRSGESQALGVPIRIARDDTADMRFLITGFPGLFVRNLALRLLSQWPLARCMLMVPPSRMDRARQELEDITVRDAALGERITLLSGDCALPNCGLDAPDRAAITAAATYVIHAAQARGFLVKPQDLAQRTNEGTENILDLAGECSLLQRFVLVSSTLIAGDRAGLIREEDRDIGQAFPLPVQESLLRSELAVQAMGDDFPAVILRPSCVVGDSHTGEIGHYDGVYALPAMIERMPATLPLPLFGPMTSYLNIVPLDFVVDAAAALSTHPRAVGRTFHLADPRPLTSGEFYTFAAARLGRKVLSSPAPRSLLSISGRRVQQIMEGIGINLPPRAGELLNLDQRLGSDNTRSLLDPMGVRCPYLPDYWDVVLDYYIAHPRTYVTTYLLEQQD